MKIRIELTDSAGRHAAQIGADVAAAARALESSVQIGDRICLGGGHADDFAVIRRRIVVEGARAILVVTLDHPARA
ncbi:MAG: hypothetical protein HXY30_11535 [Pseudorhodoplanes sp.]|nr:hypothetical protein [Pseudorhodoplanes sp.]